VVKVRGEFVWHQHEDTDEFFLVTAGRLRIRLEDQGDVALGPGELFVCPRGVRHCPVADEETWVVLLEPRETLNTGDADRAGTVGERLGGRRGGRWSVRPAHGAWRRGRGRARA